jgi:isopenicillin N synthase-like dioxygenase
MFGEGNATSMRLLNYPAIEEDLVLIESKTITRCGVHTDYGGMTLLFQDCLGGLEIQKLDGSWIR